MACKHLLCIHTCQLYRWSSTAYICLGVISSKCSASKLYFIQFLIGLMIKNWPMEVSGTNLRGKRLRKGPKFCVWLKTNSSLLLSIELSDLLKQPVIAIPLSYMPTLPIYAVVYRFFKFMIKYFLRERSVLLCISYHI
jgi:hypothetical protein